jgi:V8-like Glu-specific endopeptidase
MQRAELVRTARAARRTLGRCRGPGSGVTRPGQLRTYAIVTAVAVASLALGLYTVGRSAALASTASGQSSTPSSKTASSGPVAVAYGGSAAVGALFARLDGEVFHFCTAAVVESPAGNLGITAAHCLQGLQLGMHGEVFFAPGYHDGKFPYGKWMVRTDFVDAAWQRNRNPNDDVAFIVLGRPGTRIENLTGGEVLKTGIRLPQLVQVIGYPNTTNRPVKCSARARKLRLAGYRQLVFDCGGFTDGTSGGPFLIRVDQGTGNGYVVGVIGGYQQGGYSPSISYSARFLRNVVDLYLRAIARRRT